jgi:hypothetical protein
MQLLQQACMLEQPLHESVYMLRAGIMQRKW